LKNREITSYIFPNDLIGVIFGKEHLGWIRRLSYGTCAAFVFKQSTRRLSGMNFTSSSETSQNMEDKVVKIENELTMVKSQMQTLFA